MPLQQITPEEEAVLRRVLRRIDGAGEDRDAEPLGNEHLADALSATQETT